MKTSRRVLLVDENDDFLDGLTAWLGEGDGLEVVGRAHSRAEALQRILTHRPDVVVMDVKLPDGNGFALTRELKAGRRAPLIILMTFHDRTTVHHEALAAGADECISKADMARELISTLETLLPSAEPAACTANPPLT